ncbi:uncharacterized protein LOC126980941 [Eriocheir sinensis]|uniref:uncharacterized protein LOC126980941 n=1 Tax=Eriocheir sinensis TaxID=95602 RepID=UPI0021C9A634|nr:uncharacterized protein LOC126980941 [Eriocheir sinensis]
MSLRCSRESTELRVSGLAWGSAASTSRSARRWMPSSLPLIRPTAGRAQPPALPRDPRLFHHRQAPAAHRALPAPATGDPGGGSCPRPAPPRLGPPQGLRQAAPHPHRCPPARSSTSPLLAQPSPASHSNTPPMLSHLCRGTSPSPTQPPAPTSESSSDLSLSGRRPAPTDTSLLRQPSTPPSCRLGPRLPCRRLLTSAASPSPLVFLQRHSCHLGPWQPPAPPLDPRNV